LSTTLAAGVFIGEALAAQTHMDRALDYLQSARGELRDAEANKGGHREKAMKLVDDAIDEVREGIRYAR
jgi:hypothetical protein